VNRVAILAVCSALAACGEFPRAEVASRTRLGIRGGVEARGANDVFRLDIRGNTGITSTCSATLIAPSTLLTAAHCVDPVVLGATSVELTATNAPTLIEMTSANTFAVSETRLHPDWRPAINLEADLALVRLTVPQAISPRAWNQGSLDGRTGQLVRVLGYGAPDGTMDGGMGTRREVELPIRQLSPQLISLGDFTGKGLCHGDSGGPTLLLMDDGVERLIGVHSFTRSADCTDGADTRTDAYAPFLDAWLTEKEDTCGSDGLCSTKTCGTADLDCLGAGEPCRSALQCPGRRCVTDPQHDAAYCSSPCPCAAPLVCDAMSNECRLPQLPEVGPGSACVPSQSWCTSGWRCDGVSAALASCSRPCSADRECTPEQQCRPGFSGQRICLAREVRLPVGRWEGPVVSRCSIGVGEAASILLGLWLVRRPGHAQRHRNC
jgi:hypothetical protein